MTDLIYTEKELVQSLREYIKAEESKLAAVKRYILNSQISPHISLFMCVTFPLIRSHIYRVSWYEVYCLSIKCVVESPCIRFLAGPINLMPWPECPPLTQKATWLTQWMPINWWRDSTLSGLNWRAWYFRIPLMVRIYLQRSILLKEHSWSALIWTLLGKIRMFSVWSVRSCRSSRACYNQTKGKCFLNSAYLCV